ncbi:MAG: GAF domain-containing protein [Gammaproteobacteria bacterium]|nr:GAF domain-containing protein [Gammaproteobacteria bacterium]
MTDQSSTNPTGATNRPVSKVERLARLNEIGIALSSQQNINVLLEKILSSAKEITNADGGTLYTRNGNELAFTILMNKSLNTHLGGTSGERCQLPPVKLFESDGTPNTHNVAAFSAVNKQTVNVDDSYTNENFDFSGTKAFDEKMHYRSKSFLTVPIIDHHDKVISVLQLINAKSHETGEIVSLSSEDLQLVESLASQAAVALSNKRLIDDQKKLFESFIELIAGAIDDKSPHTGGHCRRVPELTMLLAKATIDTEDGPMADFNMSETDFYTLKIASWLHDCGKIITPEHVVDKSTKLQTIHDRIHEVDTRFEVIKRDARIEYLEALAADSSQKAKLEADYNQRISQLEDDQGFIRMANIGGEFISDERKQRISDIAKYQWTDSDGKQRDLLSDDEIYNLHIARGTLTDEERAIINGHMSATIKMLEALPYPDHLNKVPEYAGGHHEKMDGTGYPKGLTREQMSIPARMMGIADIFEAITAPDRPYRKGNTLTEALNLLGTFKMNDHIDPDLFHVFIRERVYEKYAEEFLAPEQIDDVDINAIKGYQP